MIARHNKSIRLSLAGTLRALLACALFAGTAASARAEPFLKKTDLFQANKDGYQLYRIPGVVVTTKGTILAYCEARKNSARDWGQIDIMLRRSTDGGETWLPRQHICKVDAKLKRNPAAIRRKASGKPGETTHNNPVAIVDRKTGAVHFLFCIEYGHCFYMRSDDDGKTFSKPVDISAVFEKFRTDYEANVFATGPGHGIQLVNGRLIVPVWLSTGAESNAHRPSCVSMIYSDDHGKNWHRGDIVAAPPVLKNPSETVAVQLADGRVLFNMRHESPSRVRAIATSADGATKWSKVRLDKQLAEPICMGSIIRHSLKPTRILFANPFNSKSRARQNVSIRLSTDECKSWAITKSLEPGASGYSDLAVLPDGTILCFYERGNPMNLTMARFNLEWLEKE